MKFTSFLTVAAFAVAADKRVDREKGIIHGVALCSIGAAKGHGVLCDATTLKQMRDCANTYGSGLRVMFNPSTFDHGEASIAGLVPKDSFRIEKGKFVGDLHITKSYSHKDYILDLAETQPDTFGLSVEFSGTSEEIEKVKYARCDEIYAVTIVDQPAANVSGLFSAKDDETNPQNQNTKTVMEQKDLDAISGIFKEAVKPIEDKFEKRFAALETKLAESKDDTEPTDEEMTAAGCADGDSKEGKLAKVKAYRASLSQPLTKKDLLTFFRDAGGLPVRSNGGEGIQHDDGKITGFSARVKKYEDAGMDKNKAVLRAKNDDPKGYNKWMRDRATNVGKEGSAS